MNSMVSALDNFTAQNADDNFFQKTISSGNDSVISASAGKDAPVGSFTAKVNRLATNDLLVSDRVTLSDDFGRPAGDYSLDITAGGETSTVSFSLDGNETYEQALQKITTAVNQNDDTGASATVIRDTSTTARLTFTSEQTGADNRIVIDGDNGLLNNLGLGGNLRADSTNRKAATDTGAGYQRADYNQLNSQVDINGISVSRNSNTLDNVINGITLNLNNVQDEDESPVYLQSDVGTDKVKSFIKGLIDEYNNLLTFVKNDKEMRRSDIAINSLYSNLRSVSSNAVTSVEDGDPKYLAEVGISYNSDGTLSINDEDKLENLLQTDPQKVANLFTSEDGFAAKINSVTQNLHVNGGLILSRTNSISDQIDSTVERTEDLQDRIDRQAENMREEYEAMLEAYLEAQNQYNNLFMNADTSGYNSLLMQQ
jgi:flagellar hook-associated protein 2